MALLAGSVVDRYALAPKRTPPVVPIGLHTHRTAVDLTLETPIVFQGPGSSNGNALWDEYAVTLRNDSAPPSILESATLLDLSGQPLSPGTSP